MARKAGNTEDNNKQARWEAILCIIAEEVIGTQQDLAQRLNEKGFDVTQATVSRDIKELKLVKTALPEGGYCYRVSHNEEKYQAAKRFYSLFETAAVGVDCALNQVVIRCYTGMANAVCAAMDGIDWDGVLGTVAGDDTILIITKSESHAKGLVKKLREMER